MLPSPPKPRPRAAAVFPVLRTIPALNSSETATLPPFTVSIPNGFLPLHPPPTTLPEAFNPLTSLLARMPIAIPASTTTSTSSSKPTPGLLAHFKFGATLLAELPDLTDEIEKLAPREGGGGGDKRVLGGLYRDYSFVASAYLLEVCYERWVTSGGNTGGGDDGEKKEGGYGLGRQRLPASVARPLALVAELSGFKPFMEYAGSYALFNWRLEDPALGMQYENMRLIRAFECGLDPTSSEAGFVLVHVEMVKHSGLLVARAVDALAACGVEEREKFDEGLEGVVEAMARVNTVMETMWKRSKPNDYNSFRTFIFGITKQSMFPHGVVYEGVSEEPMSFRGESGANDSMIPLCDNLLEIEMPDTPLTEILKDFRSYRPGNHREFLEWVRDRAQDVGVKEFAMGDRKSAALYLQALNQVRDFRWRHWCFTREYILKKTSHPTATGGSPIVLWLPNQLFSVYDQMLQVEKLHGSLPGCRDIMNLVASQKHTLDKEVQRFCAERDI